MTAAAGKRRVSVPRKGYEPGARGPLAGVRVLDLTRLLSGGQLGLVLGDLGADVIKVEKPGEGDGLRRATVRDGYDAYWRAYGRNKRSITLNLRHPRGREILLQLAERVDILAENFTPGVLELICGGPDVLLERNPRLVIVRITGWGQTGPRASRPGFGTLAESFAGFVSLNGYADQAPLPPPMSLADTVAGTYAATAAIAALLNVRAAGGVGQVIDISLYEPLFSIMGPDATAYAGTGHLRQRGEGTRVSSIRGTFQTRDGHWIAISAATDELARRFFTAIDRLDLLDDDRFANAEARHVNRVALLAVLAEEFAKYTREEILDLAERNRVTIGPVYNVVDALEDEHYRARETIVEMVEDGSEEGVVMHNVVPRLTVTPAAIRLPAPALGEHNAAIYAELGLDAAELADEGVI